MPGLFHSPQQAEELLVATRNRIVDYDEILLLNCATDESCIVYEAMETRKLIDPILHPQDQVMDMEKFKAKD
ncbi:MAG TPA: hypothetical protein VLG13_01180 [Patescibacteria group bacterium]|nr:hypothetical protein [Patescibacteria group bacterium]